MLGINFNIDKVAIIENENEISYRQLRTNILQVSEVLKKKLKKKDIIFVNLENSYFYILLYFASFINNFIIVPINKNLIKKEILQLKKKLKPKILISKEFNYNSIIIKKNRKIKFDRNIVNSIFYSSGITGDRKGIMHNYKSLYNSAKNFSENYKSNDIKFLSFLPMSYMAGFLNSILNILIVNGTIIIKKNFNFELIKYFFDIIKKYKINSLWATPTNIEFINRFHHSRKNNSYLKNVYVGMDKLKLKDKLLFKKKYNINCLESYGTSECLFIAAKKKYDKNDSCGRLLRNVNIFFKNNEITVKSNSIMLGYYNNKNDLLVKKNKPYLYVGDIGQLKKNELYILGRKKDLIIKGGENIYCEDLEKKISNCKFVKNVKIIAFNDKIAGQDINCAVIPNNRNKNKYILNYISKNIPKIYHPKKILFFKDFPRTYSSKIDLKKISKNFL
jgi:acyl-coenzyme A synthetase/AMP-(fatty) acid ligase